MKPFKVFEGLWGIIKGHEGAGKFTKINEG